jgi:hypothetical protein
MQTSWKNLLKLPPKGVKFSYKFGMLGVTRKIEIALVSNGEVHYWVNWSRDSYKSRTAIKEWASFIGDKSIHILDLIEE